MKAMGTIVEIGGVADSRLPSVVRKTFFKLFFLALMASSFVVAVHAANFSHSAYLNGPHTGETKSLHHLTQLDHLLANAEQHRVLLPFNGTSSRGNISNHIVSSSSYPSLLLNRTNLN
jgi:hypothetical protein